MYPVEKPGFFQTKGTTYMNISKGFTKSGVGKLTQCSFGHGIDLIGATAVRLTLHKEDDKTMLHLSMSAAEARDLAQVLNEHAASLERLTSPDVFQDANANASFG